jgi:hypothetical protein
MKFTNFFPYIREYIVPYAVRQKNLKRLYLAQKFYEICEMPNDEHDILLIFEQRFGGECISTAM